MQQTTRHALPIWKPKRGNAPDDSDRKLGKNLKETDQQNLLHRTLMAVALLRARDSATLGNR